MSDGADVAIIEVSGMQDYPRDAACVYAEDRGFGGPVVLRVREILRDGKTGVEEWRVEPVTTYRARPA